MPALHLSEEFGSDRLIDQSIKESASLATNSFQVPMTFIFLETFQRVWYSVKSSHVNFVSDILKSFNRKNLTDKLTLSDEQLWNIKWTNVENIYVGQTEIGKLILLDTEVNVGLSKVKQMVLKNIVSSISLLVQMKQQAYHNSLDIMADVIHDIRTPIMALNMTIPALEDLNDSLQLKQNMTNTCDVHDISNECKDLRGNHNRKGNFQIEFGRSIDLVSNIISNINKNVDDYDLLRKSCLVSNSNSVAMDSISCNIGQIIEKSYISVYTSDYTRRYLCIDRNYFQRTPVIASSDTVGLLVLLTMNTLLLKYKCVTVCVCSNPQNANFSGKNEKSISTKPTNKLLNRQQIMKPDVDQSDKSRDGWIGEEESPSSAVVVTIKFSCSEIVEAQTQTSHSKWKHTWDGIRQVLEILQGSMHHTATSPAQSLSNSDSENSLVCGSHSVAPATSLPPTSFPNCSCESYYPWSACPASKHHREDVVYEVAYVLPFIAAPPDSTLNSTTSSVSTLLSEVDLDPRDMVRASTDTALESVAAKLNIGVLPRLTLEYDEWVGNGGECSAGFASDHSRPSDRIPSTSQQFVHRSPSAAFSSAGTQPEVLRLKSVHKDGLVDPDPGHMDESKSAQRIQTWDTHATEVGESKSVESDRAVARAKNRFPLLVRSRSTRVVPIDLRRDCNSSLDSRSDDCVSHAEPRKASRAVSPVDMKTVSAVIHTENSMRVDAAHMVTLVLAPPYADDIKDDVVSGPIVCEEGGVGSVRGAPTWSPHPPPTAHITTGEHPKHSKYFFSRFARSFIPVVRTGRKGGAGNERRNKVAEYKTNSWWSSRPVRVLLVEDSGSIQKSMSHFLKLIADCSVTVAFDGQHGLDLMKSETFDLIITDFEMPRMSGPQMLAAYRQLVDSGESSPERTSSCLIVGMSANRTPTNLEEAFKNGMHIFAAKSAGCLYLKILVDAVKRMVAPPSTFTTIYSLSASTLLNNQQSNKLVKCICYAKKMLKKEGIQFR